MNDEHMALVVWAWARWRDILWQSPARVAIWTRCFSKVSAWEWPCQTQMALTMLLRGLTNSNYQVTPKCRSVITQLSFVASKPLCAQGLGYRLT